MTSLQGFAAGRSSASLGHKGRQAQFQRRQYLRMGSPEVEAVQALDHIELGLVDEALRGPPFTVEQFQLAHSASH